MVKTSFARTAEPQLAVRGGDTPVAASEHGWQWAAPAAVFLLGFVLRIAYLNHESLDTDEAFTILVSQLPWHGMIRALVADYCHPPLQYLLLHYWFKTFGLGVLQARLLSALFASAAVILIYFFARQFFDRSTALVASLLTGVSQLGIWLAQESRPYGQLYFFAVLSSYLFVRALREERALYWWAFVGSSIMLLYSHYYGAFVIVGLALYGAIYRKRYRLPPFWVFGGAAITLAAYAPWMASGVISSIIGNPFIFNGRTWHTIHWFNFFAAVNSFNNGKIAGILLSAPRWTFVAGGLLFGLPAVLALKNLLVAKSGCATAERLDREGVVLAGILWLLPLCAILGLGYALDAQFYVKYVSFCAPPYYLLVARGISELRSNPLRWGLLALIVAYSVNALRTNYFMQSKSNFRDAFAYVESNHKAADCGVFIPNLSPGIQRLWSFYGAGRPYPFRVIPQEALAAGQSECDRVWVLSRDEWESQQAWAQTEPGRLLNSTHSEIEETRYYSVRVGLYEREAK
jgi:4-amino-4-deoxy-L-arabinose transferase-like glycosyltransferase